MKNCLVIGLLIAFVAGAAAAETNVPVRAESPAPPPPPPLAAPAQLAQARGVLLSAQFYVAQARFEGYGHGQFWERTYEILAQDASAVARLIDAQVVKPLGAGLPADAFRVVARAQRDLAFLATQFDGLSGNDSQWEDWATATGNGLKRVGADLEPGFAGLPTMDQIAADPALARAFARGVAIATRCIVGAENWGGNGANEYWQRTCLLMAATSARGSVMLSRMLSFAGAQLPAQVKADLDVQAAALKACALKYLNEDGSTQDWLDWSALTGKEMVRISREIDAILATSW